MNDTKTCIFAAKTNEIASHYMLKYLNKLIHSLLTIPREAALSFTSLKDKTLVESVDLVTFSIGDMLRSKCSCTEQEFIRILRIFDELHGSHPDVIKLVRIKNRLDTENNDIIINYFFAGKVECELQLSVLTAEQNVTEKNTYLFSHLIYEILRAELGPVSEMATIIAQYDPLANSYRKREGFGPELYENPMNLSTECVNKSTM